MITDDQITALSREYAEECIDPQGFSKSVYEELVDEKAENVDYVLRWLSHRFCLVEKSKVIEVYKSAKHDSKMAHREVIHNLAVASARKALLESLFPEIAKEVGEG